MHSVPPADPRRDELHAGSGEPAPADRAEDPARRRGRLSTMTVAVLMLLALVVIAVLIIA